MRPETLLPWCAAHSLAFALFHPGFWRLFKWPRTLATTTLPNRAILPLLS